ncbi:hypothetical protein R2F61_01765 [Mollicutes bacterium LVI A0078]|nr:hypothetical protein RZE84_01760 [Mollicutes bacterium LVI A0075]WOO91302.1 hypothetical protein R2F61_01765 [Mollicutes bacterium LVI A0078]
MIRAIKDNMTKNNWSIEVDEKQLKEVAEKTNIREKAFYKKSNGMYEALITESNFKGLFDKTFFEKITDILPGDKKIDMEAYIDNKLTLHYNQKYVELDNMYQEQKGKLDTNISPLYIDYANKKLKEDYNLAERDVNLYFQQSEDIVSLMERIEKNEKVSKMINQDIVVKSISEHLRAKFGKDIQVKDEDIIKNISDLVQIERLHFKENGYYLDTVVINELQKKYGMQGKYGELIKTLDNANMHASLKKEYLSQIFMNNIPEGAALYLLFTNEYNSIERIRKIIEEYKTNSNFTDFELKLIDEYTKVSNNEATELHAKLQSISDFDERISYMNSIRLQNENSELTEVERTLLMDKYQITNEEVDNIQNNLILSSVKPTMNTIEHVIDQLRIVKPQYTELETDLIKLLTNVSEDEIVNLFTEVNGTRDVNVIAELIKKYDKTAKQSVINNEVKRLYIEQNKYSDKELELIQQQLQFKGIAATIDNIDMIANELHIEESNIISQVSKLLNENRSSLEEKSVDERITELLSENKQKTEAKEKLEAELKELKQKHELLEDINEINKKKNELESELSNYKNELESKERNVLKDIADRLSVKFDVETPGNFDELLNEIINKNKQCDPEVIYIAKKKFGIRNNLFKGNKFLSNLEESEKVEVFSKLNQEHLEIIGENNFEEYVQVIK